MTTHSTDYPAGYPAGTSAGGLSATGAEQNDASVKERATEAVDQGREAAGQVAQTAVGHVQEVKDEAVQQARDLVGEARSHVTRQVGDQHQNLVSNLRSLSEELGSMAQGGQQSGTATELVSQARDRVAGVADWLEGRQPSEILDEVRTFARRRPGTFLLGALAAGVVVGRLTRGAVAAHTEDSGSDSGTAVSANGQTYGQPAGYSMGGAYGQPTTSPTPGYGTPTESGGPYDPTTGYGSPGGGYGGTSEYGTPGEFGSTTSYGAPYEGGAQR